METFETIEVKSNWLKLEEIGDGYTATVVKINSDATNPQGDSQTILELQNVTKITLEGGKKVTKGQEILMEGGKEVTEKLADDDYVIGFKNSKTYVINKIKTLSPGDRCKIVYTGQFKSGKPQPAKTVDIMKGGKDPQFTEAQEVFEAPTKKQSEPAPWEDIADQAF